MKSIPSSSYRSAAVIQSNPLMSYTGNPDLVPYGSYDAGVNYSFMPNGKFSLSAFASTWIVDDRYVYDYVPTANGILRTIRQPGGGYSQGYPDGCMVGTWMTTKSYYRLQAGWANSSWNIQLQFANFARWNWESDKSVMHSRYYDKNEQTYSINDYALAKLSVTYTFGFGKKVKYGDEATQQSGLNSGILK